MKRTIIIISLITLSLSVAFSTSYLKNISINNQKDYVIVSFQIFGRNVQYSLYPYVSSISINILFNNTKNSLLKERILSKFSPLENIDISEKNSNTLIKIYTNAKVDYKFDTGSQNGNTFVLNLYLSKKTPLIDVDYTGGKFSTLDSVLKEISKMLGRNIVLSPALDSMKVNLSLKNVRPNDLFNLVLSSVATDIGYTILNDGSYYVAKISNIVKKYNITLASLALKLSRESTYKIVVDPQVRDKMITYNSEDFSPSTILKVISLIDGVGYTFIDKNILYISTVNKIEKMFSSNYIIKTYDVPPDFDPNAISGILSTNAKLVKITDTSVLLKGLAKDHSVLKTVISNIKSKKSTYEIIKTTINPEMLKALKDVFKNVGLVQIKDKLLLTGEPASIEQIKQFLSNFTNDNYIKVINTNENSELISTFVSKYFPEINSTSIKNLVVLSGPKQAVENALTYVDKINSSLTSVSTPVSGKKYELKVINSPLPKDAINSIVSEFKNIKLLYNENGKFILYGTGNELESLNEQITSIQQYFKSASGTKNSTKTSNGKIVIKEFKISGISDDVLKNIQNIVDPSLKYYYSNNILLIKSNENSINTFIKYIQYFVPKQIANKNNKIEKQIIEDYKLQSINYELANQILNIYYPELKIDYIQALNKIILRGNESEVNGAIEKLQGLSSEISSKKTTVKSTEITKWIHLNYLKPSQAQKIAENYANTVGEKIKVNAIDSTGYLMLSGKENNIQYLEKILTDMDNSMKSNTVSQTSSASSTNSSTTNSIYTVSSSEVSVSVRNISVSDLIYTVSKLLSKDIMTNNLSGNVSLSVSKIDFDGLLNLLSTEKLITYNKENKKYIIFGRSSEKVPQKSSMVSTVLTGYDTKNISQMISSLYNIQVVPDEKSQTLILKGASDEIEKAKKLINELSNGSDRIYISIKITSQDISGKESYGNSINVTDSNGNSVGIPNSNSDSQYIGFNVNGNKLQFTGSKLRNSSANILSQPNVVTINGKTVHIHIGQSFSKIIQSNSGNSTGGVQASQNVKEFNTGIVLDVTPIILINGKILLTLNLNVSKITGFNDGIPVTEDKQVTSTIIVDNGQKVSFGGLEEVSEEKQVQKLPFLGDLPFIGSFFSSSQNIKKKYDLSFEITATIVK